MIAEEHIDECSDKELEDFVLKLRALEIHIFPGADDLEKPTVAGIVSFFRKNKGLKFESL